MTSFSAALNTPVNFAVPAGACDCHVHVYLDQARYPMSAKRWYTPPPATEAELLDLQRFLGFGRVVIVQPSNYGSDNAATLQGVKFLGLTRARAVIVIDDTTTAAELDAYAMAGARGVRLNLALARQVDPAEITHKLFATAKQIEGRGWHIQVVAKADVLGALKDTLAALPVPVVIDHFGYAPAALGLSQPGFGAIVDLVRRGTCYVKISGAYRNSTQAPHFADVKPFAQALIGANPDRILWGSDWPHPDGHAENIRPMDITPNLEIDDGAVLNQLVLWAPDSAIRKKILVDNPARLYDF